MEPEEWSLIRNKDIKENTYLISTYGRIKNFYTGKILKESTINSEYKIVQLISSSGNNKYKKMLVHRLVGEEFVHNDNPYKNTINHKDGNKLNNNASNLEWCTQSENNLHAKQVGLNNNYGVNSYKSKFTQDEVHIICDLLSKNTPYKKIISSIGLDVNNPNNYDLIGNIKRRITYTDISNNYIFPKTCISKKYSEEQIRYICKCIEENKSVAEIYTLLFKKEYINSTINKKFYDDYLMIKHRKLYTEISCEYNF